MQIEREIDGVAYKAYIDTNGDGTHEIRLARLVGNGAAWQHVPTPYAFYFSRGEAVDAANNALTMIEIAGLVRDAAALEPVQAGV